MVAPNRVSPSLTDATAAYADPPLRHLQARGAARYVASGEVSGRLLNQYSLSDYAGYLRVATTTGDALADEPGDSNAVSTSSSSVYVLRAGTLTKVGELDGLGKRERIYAVRFIGALGYVVTFQQIGSAVHARPARSDRPPHRGRTWSSPATRPTCTRPPIGR